jgi:diguanylate cyclase (GGDEF)-like protein
MAISSSQSIDQSESKRHPIVFMRWLTALCCAVSLSTLALGVTMLMETRNDARQQAEQTATNLAQTLQQEIERTITVYDLSLQGTADAAGLPGLKDVSSAIYRSALFDRASAAPYLNSILLLDAAGNVIADARSAHPGKLNLADREYFTILRANPNFGLFISRAIISRLNPGEPILELSRRIPTQDGHFAGITSGGLRLDYFRDLFSQINLGPRGTITLLRLDGHIIYRYPLHDGDIDQNLSRSPVFARYGSAMSGAFIALSEIDHTQRLFAFRRIGTLPLIIDVSMSVDDIYATWWPKALTIGAILFLLSGATLMLCLMVRREMGHRLIIEEALELMAVTDGLTQLLNRRAFDVQLERAWKQAIREKAPVSLLMLDADFFKSYNDHYGHQAGDEVLRRVAQTVQASLLRPNDVAARFGGEEFVVLLPSTGEAGATTIAAKIQAAIAQLAIAHADNATGLVTLSIGVAVETPEHRGASAATMLKHADEALYQAKESGRNRTVVWEPDSSFTI